MEYRRIEKIYNNVKSCINFTSNNKCIYLYCMKLNQIKVSEAESYTDIAYSSATWEKNIELSTTLFSQGK